MTDKKLIKAIYANACEQIKLKNPQQARKYVLMLLNDAGKTYYSPDISIVTKAKTAAFLDKWLQVSRDLYDKGITDYVLECFGLAEESRKGGSVPAGGRKVSSPSAAASAKPKAAGAKEKAQKPAPAEAGAGIDYSGLIDETVNEQGWGAEIFEANKSAVVQISAVASMQIASGTGFIISKNGYLLTNDHVVFDEEAGNYYTKLKMSLLGDKKKYSISVMYSDKKSDVALCKFDPAEIPGFESVKRITDYTKVKPGADCIVIGNAFGMGLAPCIGNIRFTKNDCGNLVYTIPSNPGDSGGPVFNRSGECIGINKSRTVAVNGTAAEGYANATPMDTIDALLQKWTESSNITL